MSASTVTLLSWPVTQSTAAGLGIGAGASGTGAASGIAGECAILACCHRVLHLQVETRILEGD